jgi:hypothetical protein
MPRRRELNNDATGVGGFDEFMANPRGATVHHEQLREEEE